MKNITNKQLNFDIYEPKIGHEIRFKNKLKQKKKNISLKKWMIAASILLLVGTGINFYNNSTINDEIPPQILNNQTYFSSIIKEKLKEINHIKTKETEKVFTDALKSISRLENDYKKLLNDYKINKDKYIINVMIDNFQQRIEILEFVQEQIDNIKQTKLDNNEINTI